MSDIAKIRAEIAELNAKARAHRDTHNEGGDGYNPFDEKIEDAHRRLRQAEMADYVRRWPELRAAWNAAVAKHTRAGQVATRDIAKIEAEVGITLGDLRAVKAAAEAA